jgi:hypothetical protein
VLQGQNSQQAPQAAEAADVMQAPVGHSSQESLISSIEMAESLEQVEWMSYVASHGSSLQSAAAPSRQRRKPSARRDSSVDSVGSRKSTSSQTARGRSSSWSRVSRHCCEARAPEVVTPGPGDYNATPSPRHRLSRSASFDRSERVFSDFSPMPAYNRRPDLAPSSSQYRTAAAWERSSGSRHAPSAIMASPNLPGSQHIEQRNLRVQQSLSPGPGYYEVADRGAPSSQSARCAPIGQSMRLFAQWSNDAVENSPGSWNAPLRNDAVENSPGSWKCISPRIGPPLWAHRFHSLLICL